MFCPSHPFPFILLLPGKDDGKECAGLWRALCEQTCCLGPNRSVPIPLPLTVFLHAPIFSPFSCAMLPLRSTKKRTVIAFCSFLMKSLSSQFLKRCMEMTFGRCENRVSPHAFILHNQARLWSLETKKQLSWILTFQSRGSKKISRKSSELFEWKNKT